MRDNVTISYRGARYEIGRGHQFYGIWVAGTPQEHPLEWWPETPVGWSHAWARFTGIEVPGTIVAVAQHMPPPPPPPSAPSGPAGFPAGQDAPPGAPDASAATPDASPVTPDAFPVSPDASPVSPDAFPVSQGTQPVAADAATATADAATADAPSAATGAPPVSADTDPNISGLPDTISGQPGTPGELDGSADSGQPDDSTVLVGQPVMPAGQTAALAFQPTAPVTVKAARTGLRAQLAGGLIIIGVICGVVGLFPDYLAGGSLLNEPANLVPHAIYFAAWFGAAALILVGGALRRLGALLAVGISVVTFGLFFADMGTAISGGTSAWATGLVLGLIGWAVCAAGSGLAFRATQAGQPEGGKLRRFGVLHVLTLVAALGALGTAIAFAPSWDSYLLRAANGASVTRTLGNAFDNPGWVITGDVFVMILVVVVIVMAAAWRPVRDGAWLMAGAIIPMAAQAISALVQVGEPTSPTVFNISPAEAAQYGITITNGLTPAFWLYCAFVVVVMLTCGWMLLSPRSAVLDTPPPAFPYPPGVMPGAPYHAIPGATFPGATPGYLPAGGFQQVVQQQQLGDGQRL